MKVGKARKDCKGTQSLSVSFQQKLDAFDPQGVITGWKKNQSVGWVAREAKGVQGFALPDLLDHRIGPLHNVAGGVGSEESAQKSPNSLIVNHPIPRPKMGVRARQYTSPCSTINIRGLIFFHMVRDKKKRFQNKHHLHASVKHPLTKIEQQQQWGEGPIILVGMPRRGTLTPMPVSRFMTIRPTPT